MDVQAGHATASQFYEVATPGGAVHHPAPGRAWSVTKPRMDELVGEGKVYFGLKNRGKPNLIRYLDEDEGLVPWTWWPHEEVGHNDEAKKEILTLFPGVEPFGTPKPERLMERIIRIATNPGDLVLDCFVGSGTTAAVAHKLGRRWVAAEAQRATIETFTNPRLDRVISGSDDGGISKTISWQGGGGFRVMDVAPSMFQVIDGRVVLADWATGGALAEAVAAQSQFEFDDDAPFSGRKRRHRLAVVDGLVNEDVVRLLVPWLNEGEMLTVYGTAVDPACKAVLSDLCRGSVVKRIPQSVLDDYRRKESRTDGLDWPTLNQPVRVDTDEVGA